MENFKNLPYVIIIITLQNHVIKLSFTLLDIRHFGKQADCEICVGTISEICSLDPFLGNEPFKNLSLLDLLSPCVLKVLNW